MWPGAKRIEAAAGEAGAQAGAAPALDALGGDLAPDDLALRAAMRRDRREQVAFTRHGDADLADDDAGGDVGEAGRERQVATGREGRGEGRDRGVAGARDVEHLGSLGAEMPGAVVR